jgi:DNA invertase Pin-like site-specific DNA recombinase
MDKAIGYVRVSSEEQSREGVSLDAQTARLEAYAKAAGLELVEVIREEGVSGSVPLKSRPAGRRLAELDRKSDVKHILAIRLDRLFRSAEDCLAQTRAWDKSDRALHLLDFGGASIDTRSAIGRLFLTMAAAFAELERSLVAERTSMALAHMKAKRSVYSPPPLGFNVEGDRLEADPVEMVIVDRIRRERASGRTLMAIADDLNREGVPTKKGGSWYACTVRKIAANSIYADRNGKET